MAEKPEIKFKQCNDSNFMYGRTKNGVKHKIQWIVIHFTAGKGDTAKNNADYFARCGGLNASAHFFVDENEIWQTVNLANTAWHCGSETGYYYNSCRNVNSIGIEMCSDWKNGEYVITMETQKRTVKLVQWLMEQYGIDINHICMHYHVTHKYCLPLDSTELLTREGWKALGDIKVGEEVMQYDTNTDRLSFGAVSSVVKPYEAEVLKNHNFEATANHRMWAKTNCATGVWREKIYGEMLTGGRQNIIKNGALYEGKGLDLTDDELRLLVWVQGDGHYRKNYEHNTIYGLEFHFKKQRKIDRLTTLLEDLGIDYRLKWRADGSAVIRTLDDESYKWCEQWLDEKKFTFDFIEMTQHQFEVFWEEILQVDGCKSGDLYTSAIPQNLDVVQAICATKGIRTNRMRIGSGANYKFDTIDRLNSNYTITNRRTVTYKRNTMVSCVSVPTGYILIRQNNKTFIVGNCPEPFVLHYEQWTNFLNMVKNKENDMTKAETTAIAQSEAKKIANQVAGKIAEQVYDKYNKVYNSVAEVPDWGKATIKKLVDKGYLKGNGKGLDLSEDLLRVLVINDRAGMYGSEK